jgi:hypothetical protein
MRPMHNECKKCWDAACAAHEQLAALRCLPSGGTLAAQQAKPTVATLKGLTQLLNCAATHPDAEMRFHASDVALHIDSDASHLSESKARSRAAGHHCSRICTGIFVCDSSLTGFGVPQF